MGVITQASVLKKQSNKKKAKLTILLSVLVIASGIFITRLPSGQNKIATQFLNKYYNGDSAEAYALTTSSYQKQVDPADFLISTGHDKNELDNLKVTDVNKQDDNTMNVGGSFKFKNTNIAADYGMRLVKEGGTWYVDAFTVE